MTKLWEAFKKKVENEEPLEDLEDDLEELDKRLSVSRVGRLLQKDGQFSLTRTILIAAWGIGIALYVFGSLFSGSEIPLLSLTIPSFDSGNFLAVTGAASSLYWMNHSVKIGNKHSPD